MHMSSLSHVLRAGSPRDAGQWHAASREHKAGDDSPRASEPGELASAFDGVSDPASDLAFHPAPGPRVASGLPASLQPPGGGHAASAAPPPMPGAWSSIGTAARAGLRNGLLVGAALATAFTFKAAVVCGLGEVRRHDAQAFEALAVAGVSVVAGVGAWLGGKVLAQALHGLTGLQLSNGATRALQVAVTGGALAAQLAPALQALHPEDSEDSVPLGQVLLANNLGQLLYTLLGEVLVHLGLSLGGSATEVVEAGGLALQPGTPRFQQHLQAPGRFAAWAVPAWLAHGLSIYGSFRAIAPLAHALGGPAPGEAHFGRDAPMDLFTAFVAAGLMAAAVEAVRPLSTGVLQAIGQARQGLGTRPVPHDPAAPAARGLPAYRLDDAARLRLLVYPTLLNLSTAAVVTGPQAAPIRWMTSDPKARQTAAECLSTLAWMMIASADALAPLARHAQALRPAAGGGGGGGGATVEVVVPPAPEADDDARPVRWHDPLPPRDA